MEEMPRYVLVIAAAAVAFALFLNTRRRGGIKPQCPNCEQRDTVETGRETLNTRTVQPEGSGTPGGGSVRLQLDIEAAYHCNSCGHSFKRRFTETH